MTSPTITDNPGADAMICAASLARHSRAFPFSSPPDSCCLGSRPQRGAGQGERGAGKAATRPCRHLSPLASRAWPCEHDENGKALGTCIKGEFLLARCLIANDERGGHEHYNNSKNIDNGAASRRYGDGSIHHVRRFSYQWSDAQAA